MTPVLAWPKALVRIHNLFQSNKCFDKIFLLRFCNLHACKLTWYADIEFYVCRYGILGMQIWTFSKHHKLKYDFWEKTQYSNMNFWCFLVTPAFVCIIMCFKAVITFPRAVAQTASLYWPSCVGQTQALPLVISSPRDTAPASGWEA